MSTEMDASFGPNREKQSRMKSKQAFLLKREGDFLPKLKTVLSIPAKSRANHIEVCPASLENKESKDLRFRRASSTLPGTPSPSGRIIQQSKTSFHSYYVPDLTSKHCKNLQIPSISEVCVPSPSNICLLQVPKLNLNMSRPISECVKSPRTFRDAKILYEGELMKYRPCISSSFLARWCQLTSTEFKFFKSSWCANFSNDKPVVCFSLHQIEYVKRVRFQKSNHGKGNCFEIFLYDELKMPSISRYTDSLHITKNSMQMDSLLKRPVRSESPEKLGYTQRTRSPWTIREEEWFNSEKKLLFSANDRETANNWVNFIRKAKVNCK